MTEQNSELIPKDIIRIETALSRFPVHRLAKQGSISIEIKDTRPTGEVKTNWEVTYNSKYGQPGPLAYKLDTLIINRRIEEAGKPVPKLMKLGSLSEICKELGVVSGGKIKSDLKTALYQNAFAGITAKITYKQTDGTERNLDAGFTRYSAILTGETLPNGSKADAVYLVLNDIYMQILNTAQTRPLDYDYLKELTPGAQRFYELLSYQIFAALKYNHPNANYLYSVYCTYAPQTRYDDWEHVRKQMYKIHLPHIKSGYIEKVYFEEIWSENGTRDWMMKYVPGPKARGEHKASQRKHRTAKRKEPEQLLLAAAAPAPEQGTDYEAEHLVAKLKSFGIAETKARSLIQRHQAATEAQIAAYPYREGRPQKNAAGWLVAAIEGNYTLPALYLEAEEKKSQAMKAKAQKSAVEVCPLCDENGWRRVKSEQYPRGAMKRCSHDRATESRYEEA